MKKVSTILYYSFAQYLPDNHLPFIGTISRKIRCRIAQGFCTKVAKNANINKHVYLMGGSVSIGEYSGLGANSKIQNTILTIGNDVMIGEWLSVLGGGHKIDSIEIPMRLQGTLEKTHLEVCDDVWIGAHVIITAGCHRIGKGAIIGAGSVVTHDVKEYTIVAGNPAKEIRKRER